MTIEKYLNKDPGDLTIKWSEFMIQCYIVQEGRRAGYLVVGNTEQGNRINGGRLKAAGMTAGNPDLMWVLKKGLVAWIELKTKDGVLNKAQKFHHAKLESLGHKVFTVYAESPLDGWNKCKRIVEGVRNG